MSTFRALCAELLQPLAEYDGANPYHEHRDLITRARAELAKPEAELPPRPPLATAVDRPDLVRYGVTWDGSPDKPLLTPVSDGYWTPWHIAARLPQPTPMSERLPKPDDLDNNRSTDIKDVAAFQSKRICAIVDHTADHLHEIKEIGKVDPALLVFGLGFARIILRRLSQVIKDLPDFDISFDESEPT